MMSEQAELSITLWHDELERDKTLLERIRDLSTTAMVSVREAAEGQHTVQMVFKNVPSPNDLMASLDAFLQEQIETSVYSYRWYLPSLERPAH